MRANITYIAAEKFATIILAAKEKHGFTLIQLAGYVRIQGPKGRQMYVPLAKRVSKVDLSGFTVEMAGVKTLDILEAHGSVKQQIDFGKSEDDILSTFSNLLDHMASLPAVEKVERKQASKKEAGPGWDLIAASVSPSSPKAERLKKVAKKAAVISSSPEA